jgi:DMSO/TMAO reductase YedYZ molybdopterin-dependent catalytic subunit
LEEWTKQFHRPTSTLNIGTRQRAVTFDCADNYTTSLFREELSGDDEVLAYKLNDETLDEGLGFPVRLIVPSKYAYKSALWVVGLRFTRGQGAWFLGAARV